MKSSWWLDALKGVLIGLGMLAPGLSGGVFAVVLGVYPRIINGINQLWKKPWHVLQDLFWIGIGGLIGLIITFFIILTLIDYAPLPFTLLFLGFIVGSIPEVFKKQHRPLAWKSHGAVTLLSSTFVFILPFLPSQTHQLDVVNVQTMFTLLLVGFVLAGTLIIPGISGSLVLLVLGFYVYLFQTARDLLDGLIAFDGSSIMSAGVPLLLVGIGLFVGVVVFAYVLSWLLKKYQSYVYSGVLGLLLTSPFSILIEAMDTYPNLWANLGWSIPLGILFLGLGFYGGFILKETEGHS